MFKVTPNGKNRIDIELSGKLDSDEMRTALDDLVDKSDNIENGIMLYDVIDFHMPSLSAIAIEFSRLPEMFGLIRKFSKAAVLSDKTSRIRMGLVMAWGSFSLRSGWAQTMEASG